MSLRLYVENPTAAGPARVGVVIPVYNRRTILLETLPYVLRQTRQPDQLVVADDGSTDGSADAAEAWLADAKPTFDWRVVRLGHRNAAAARCDGHKALPPVDYVAFLDSDDHWPLDFLERTTAALDANPAATLALVDRRYTDLLGTSRKFVDSAHAAAGPLAHLFRYGAGIASCSLMRASAHDAVGGWDPRLEIAEDTMFFSLVATEGPWVHVVGEPVDYYLGNAQARGEHNNLSRQYAYVSFRWARSHEAVLARVQERAPGIDDRPLRRSLGRFWYNAGKEMLIEGHPKAARLCFSRSVAWNALQYRGWRRLLTA